MNTSALKSFAPAVRRQLMEAVGRKLDYALSADTADLRAKAAQVASLRLANQRDRTGLIERVAYTWFNRLAALRFLDAHGWHPFNARVITPASPSETQPELLKLMRNGTLPVDLARSLDMTRLNNLLDGNLTPSTPGADPQGEVYRHLILAACHFYHLLMPWLFEAIDDETELLLPDDLLTEQSVAQGFRADISDEDCAEVEVLGWLYQFYISEKKDQVMARKKAVPSEDIPAVTQIWTPHWIARYLVENSLGRLWLLNHPTSRLREHMPYYIECEAETDFLKIVRPEEIRMLDSACGSGHLLTYGFDLLYHIYEEEGYAPGDIPTLILQHNLYGLEICPRATQLAQFALICKAREKSRGAFRRPVQPMVMCLQDVVISDDEMKVWLRATGLQQVFTDKVLEQVQQFRENTSTFGSLIQPLLSAGEIATLENAIGTVAPAGEIFLQETHRKIRIALDQALMLTQRYHVVMANPPYMGNGGYNSALSIFVAEHYASGKADLYACFIVRNAALCLMHGLFSMITIPNWMFLESFENLRTNLLRKASVASVVHNGRGLWGSDFGSCAFVISNAHGSFEGAYKRLFLKSGEVNSPEELERRFLDHSEYPFFRVVSAEFLLIPGAPFAYWVSKRIREAFTQGQPIGELADIRQGLATGDNSRFMRAWPEVSNRDISFDSSNRAEADESEKLWFPYNKGGAFRRWYGNAEFVVNWRNDGDEIRNFMGANGRLRSRPQNMGYFFRESISWSKVTIGSVAFRSYPEGFIFDVAGCSLFVHGGLDKVVVLGFLNSRICTEILRVLSPTMNYEVGHIGRLPFENLRNSPLVPRMRETVAELVSLAKVDWDSTETSWGFLNVPLLRPEDIGTTLEISWRKWESYLRANIAHMHDLETENNRLWIEAYGLQNELSPKVPEDEITLARPDRRKDMAAFLSYAVGCMMGRYSLDKPGLILADAGDTLDQYVIKVGKTLDALSFVPDQDGIIPILDGEWFEDDVVARVREFLRVTFGAETLAENIRFIEESLGKDLRKYFLTDFYKDHLQTYKKRPIYWMFQSPKKGFQCLIYLHRYTRDTVNRVLNRYLREYIAKLRARIEQLEHLLATEGASTRDRTLARKENEQLKKTLRECEDWERDVLLPLAQQRIELDLDDGVKVNYLKLGAALAPIAGLAAQEED